MLKDDRRLSRSLAHFILVTLLAMPASAAEQSGNLPQEASNPAVQAAWSACKPDIARFCPAVVPGGGRIVQCLVAHAGQLTTACRDGMLTAKTALGR